MSESPLTLLIVDDEPLAREGIRQTLSAIEATGVDVIGECENAASALSFIKHRRPDILLLDVAMPAMDGFEMLECLEPEVTPPAVIFVTAYDEHAVRAFETEAIGYLVKPVGAEKLRIALDKAARRIVEARRLNAGLPAAEAEAETDGPRRFISQLMIPDKARRLVVPVEEIDWIEGETYYVRVHAQKQSRLLRARLSQLEMSLDPRQFLRCHRSAIVRLAAIREIRQDSVYTCSAILASGARIPVSKSKLKQLQARLSGR